SRRDSAAAGRFAIPHSDTHPTVKQLTTRDTSVMAFGAVLGRTALLSVPTLAGGVVAMVTLFVLQRLLALAQKTRLFGASLRQEPVLLMVG
ncbi:hypothetical protein AB0383_50005, partial [Amycolatopsis sp. NPDC051373]|uniref:hypothetical protein n=1 Tax=Amycolatopsis sp. NPDC051373 TaxID=3155801 RepID=UPI00344C3829